MPDTCRSLLWLQNTPQQFSENKEVCTPLWEKKAKGILVVD